MGHIPYASCSTPIFQNLKVSLSDSHLSSSPRCIIIGEGPDSWSWSRLPMTLGPHTFLMTFASKYLIPWWYLNYGAKQLCPTYATFLASFQDPKSPIMTHIFPLFHDASSWRKDLSYRVMELGLHATWPTHLSIPNNLPYWYSSFLSSKVLNSRGKNWPLALLPLS